MIAAEMETRMLADEHLRLVAIAARTRALARALEQDRLELDALLFQAREGRGAVGRMSVQLANHREAALEIAAMAEHKP